MNHRRTTAAAAFLALVPATMATTGAAWAAEAHASVHGCPFHAVCVYDSTAAYDHDEPTVTDTTQGRGVVLFAATADAVTVNNTNGTFSSEGNPEAHIIKGGGEICLYVPDLSDVQSPGVTENPAAGDVQAIDRGPSKESVETDYPLPMSDCGS
jgi:hypothetical protein